MNEQKLNELESRIKWNKKHLRIVFIISVIALLAIAGHFYLHATGKLPH
ncbi:MAG: hypothetical protein MRY83_04105 [Flavobacteriales bacterium]|nr:hypothetical protein [Flavobacteriales bacterium]